MKNRILTLTLSILTSFFALAQNPGDLDQSFGTDGTIIFGIDGNPLETFQDVAIQDDQKIVAVGMSWDANYVASMIAVRYLTDGSIDMDFGDNGKFVFSLDYEALAYSCTITDEGKIIIAGATTDYTDYNVLLIQLNPDGSADATFGDNGIVIQQFSTAAENFQDFSYGVTVDENENILIAGSSYNEEYLTRPYVARFSNDGTLDTTFGVDGIATIPVVQSGNSFDCILVQPDGKIVAAGTYSPEFLWNVMLIVRLNDDGSLDTEFGDEGIVTYSHNAVDDEIFNIALTPEGNIVAAGFSATANYTYGALIVQFTPDGSIDTSFGTNGTILENEESYNEGGDIQVQNDGKILLGGTTGDGPPNAFDMVIWKYNADGSKDLDFGENGIGRQNIPGYYAMIHGIALQADNKIVAVGQIRNPTNQNDFMVARFENGVDISVGINNIIYQNAPVISPNPALSSNQLNIQFSEDISANANLEFYSITGKLMYSAPINNEMTAGNRVTANIPVNISNGIYLVSISQKGVRSAATKLVIIE